MAYKNAKSLTDLEGMTEGNSLLYTDKLVHEYEEKNLFIPTFTMDRKYGRLSNGGLAQVVFGLGHSVGVGLVHENEFAERLAEQRRHHPIGFGKNFRHNRLDCAEWLQHVHVLRALAT